MDYQEYRRRVWGCYTGKAVGGTVLAIHPDTNHNELQLLFVNIDCHSKGVGRAAWRAIEMLHPETVVWETNIMPLPPCRRPNTPSPVRTQKNWK